MLRSKTTCSCMKILAVCMHNVVSLHPHHDMTCSTVSVLPNMFSALLICLFSGLNNSLPEQREYIEKESNSSLECQV